MTSSSSRSDPPAPPVLALLGSAAAAAVAALSALMVGPIVAAVAAAASGALALLALLALSRLRAELDGHRRVVDRVAAVANEIVAGNFEARLLDIREEGRLAQAQHAVNDMIDRCDAFVREATASLDAVCRSVYYRRILPGGLNGSFRVAADAINGSIATQAKAVEEARTKAAAELRSLIETIGRGLRMLAEGDLGSRLADLPPAYRQIEADFNLAASRLAEALGEVIGGTQTINLASREIAEAAHDLSRRTEQQAAALEETAAALHQISQTVAETEKGARHATDTVSTAKSEADEGAETVRRAVAAMDLIRQSSGKIENIVEVIDGIAFQTNLLALNAAVEAARAGEAGRGFAVVAAEVRALSQRSAEAAKEIKRLILSSSDSVRDGSERVVAAGQAIGQLVARIGDVERVVGAIAVAAREQSTALQDINIAVNQVDQDTQKNAAMVEETTAATQSLTFETDSLVRLVTQFRLAEEAGRAAASGETKRPAADPAAPTIAA